MRRTKEDAELTRQSLLDAALTVFSRQGYAATRLEDVAEAAGVTRGAIYHHFGSKRDLFMALIEDASAIGSQAIQQAIVDGGTFQEIGRRVLVKTLDLLARDTRFRGVMALLLLNSGDSPELADLRRLREQEGLKMLEEITGFFHMGLASGQIRSNLDPAIGARAFIAYQNGLALLWTTSPGVIDFNQHAEGLADVFIRGIQ